MRNVLIGLQTVFKNRAYAISGAAAFVLALLFYLMTLPSSFTGGRIGFTALRFLNLELVVFSVVMAALVAMLLPVIVFLMRAGMRSRKASATGGVIVGATTPILCCSPVLPIAFGYLAALFPSLVGSAGGRLQGFIATHQTELFTVATILLIVAIYQNARSVARGLECAVPSDDIRGRSEYGHSGESGSMPRDGHTGS